MDVTGVEQRTYVKIVVLRGRNTRDCHSELVKALANYALPYRTVLEFSSISCSDHFYFDVDTLF
jgi:hypothetical protein